MKVKLLSVLLILVLSIAAPMAFAPPPHDMPHDPPGEGGPHSKKTGKMGHLYIYSKEPTDWDNTDEWGPEWGKLTFTSVGTTFDFVFNGHELEAGESYSLIYYPEPQTTWPWPVEELASSMANADGNIHLAGSWDPEEDLEDIKIWLVLSDDIVDGEFTYWHPTEYLFEHNLIDFDDTDVP